MKTRLLIVTAVLAAAAAVLWSKREVKPEPSPTPSATATVEVEGERRATVLLFADPREAEESCGCAEIIRMVRDLRGTPGVLVREIDARSPGEDGRRHGVRTSPAVVILGATGDERGRFEGESARTIASVRSALKALRRSSAPSSKAATP